MGCYRKEERGGSVGGLFSMFTVSVVVLSATLASRGGALAQNGNASPLTSNATTSLPLPPPTGPLSVLDEGPTAATAAPYIPPGGRECNAEMRQCRDGMILPAWRPIENISAFDKAGRATVYILVLFYLFLGVSIIADRFMAAIEVITSTEREVTILRPNGESVVVNVRVWNETVSNLTLMALGSSAPEILLSIIEVVGNRFEAGDLGPGTIVGSAAFNLFVITGLCVLVIPNGEVRKIKHLRVFFITATWSIFAYLWLYIIIALSSPDRVDVWEAVLTFLFFPATVLTAYVVDKKIFFNNFLSRRIRARVAGSTGPVVEGRENLELGAPAINGVSSAQDAAGGVTTGLGGPVADDKGLDEFEKTRREYIDILRDLRRRKPDADMATLESMAAAEVLNRGPKSRAYYRIQATRKMTGGGNLIKRKTAAADRRESLIDGGATVLDENLMRVFFEPAIYTVFENVGKSKVTVVRQGGDIANTTAYVDYRTEDGTANVGTDYDFAEGTLVFHPGETQCHVEIGVIDDDVFEEDEHFFVNLSNVRCESTTGSENRIKLVDPITATVTILDDDHSGIFHFELAETSFPESAGEAQIRVVRSSGARGKVALPYKSVNGTAIGGGTDFEDVIGELIFKNDETEAYIKVKVINREEYEKNVSFCIELSEPRVIVVDAEPLTDPTDGNEVHPLEKPLNEEDMTDEQRVAELGKPRLSEPTTISCHIRESTEFKSTVDKLLRKANMSLVVGTSSWREQFIEAVTVSAGDDDDGDDDKDGEEKPDQEKEVDEAKKVPSLGDYVLHILSLFWKILFAFVPPTDYFGGWAAFTVSIIVIGLLTAVIGDVASHFGCTVGLQDAVTALSFVALGTSIPDTFASKVAAIGDEYADSSIGNVTGSNAVNVFLGIGIAWTIAAVYHAAVGTPGGFAVAAGSLGFSVTVFCGCAFVTIIILLMRRSPSVGGELGGPPKYKYATSAVFFGLWIFYVLMSSLECYCYIEGF